jgi:hypothetical protein
MNPTDCAGFERWLDEGNDALAAAHAAACPACSPRWVAERAVSALWAGAAPAPRADFVEGVLARVAVTPQDVPPTAKASATLRPLAAIEGAMIREALPWWVRAAGQPACALALALAAVVAAFLPQLLGMARDFPQWSAGAVTVLTGTIAPWLGRADSIAGRDPAAGVGVALALVPLMLVVSTALFRLGVSLTTVRFAAPASRRGRGLRGS